MGHATSKPQTDQVAQRSRAPEADDRIKRLQDRVRKLDLQVERERASEERTIIGKIVRRMAT